MTTETVTAMDAAITHITADHIASSTARCALTPNVALSPYVVPEAGYCVVVRALEDKSCYDQLEGADETFRTIEKGDVIVGTLGSRQALKGYSGHVPRQIEVGDTLNVLNLGGIIGTCTSGLPELGSALSIEVLGAAMVQKHDGWTHARIQDGAIEPAQVLNDSAPLIVVSGTAMDTGKTLAACQIVEGLTAQGMEVAAAKLTGASLMRDVRRMHEHGATACVTFADAGLVSSIGETMPPIAKGLIAHLNARKPDAIILEMGDGFIGPYGVDDLLLDKELQRFTKAHVVTATDLAGVWAAEQHFHQRYRAPITAITGPVTDNEVGTRYVEQRLGIPAMNALQSPKKLVDCVAHALQNSASTSTLPLLASIRSWFSLTPRASRLRATSAAMATISLSFSRGVSCMGSQSPAGGQGARRQVVEHGQQKAPQLEGITGEGPQNKQIRGEQAGTGPRIGRRARKFGTGRTQMRHVSLRGGAGKQ